MVVLLLVFLEDNMWGLHIRVVSNPGWARKEHFFNFSSFCYILSHFSSIFSWSWSTRWAARLPEKALATPLLHIMNKTQAWVLNAGRSTTSKSSCQGFRTFLKNTQFFNYFFFSLLYMDSTWEMDSKSSDPVQAWTKCGSREHCSREMTRK